MRGGEKMKKLRKKLSKDKGTLIAYACYCTCTGSCNCACFLDPRDDISYYVIMGHARENNTVQPAIH
jgi:putative bacteriocin precursor